MKRFSLFFILLLCGSAFGLEETIKPSDTVVNFNQWAEFGGGWKIAKLTDDADGTFIKSGNVSDTDRYVTADPAQSYTNYTIDSVVYWIRMKGTDPLSGNIRFGAIIGSDVVSVNIVLEDFLSASFADFSVSFPLPPGTRGTWDETEIDSLVQQICLTSISANDTVFICDDSVRIYATLNVSASFNPEKAGASTFAARCNNAEDSIPVGAGTYLKLDVANVVIHTSELVSGHRYLILYNAALGGTNSAGNIAVRVMYGATEIAEANYETDNEANLGSTGSDNGPRSAQGGELTGFYILDANGTDSLWLERKWDAANAGYVSGKCLMAIDLNNLTNNTHYFDSCVNGAGIVMTDSSNATTDTTMLQDSYTTVAGDYLVLASGEVWDSLNASTSFTKQCYLSIDGTIQGPLGGGAHTWESVSDFWNWSYAKIHTFTAGSHTFRIHIGNIDTPASGVEVYGRRPRIILIRRSAYVEMEQREHNNFIAITNDYNTWGTDTSLQYTNNTGTTENVVLIANGSVRGIDADDHAVVRIYNNSDAIAFSEVGTGNPRNAEDTIAVTSIGFISQIGNGVGKQILYRATGDSTTNNQTLGFVRLIAWNLKEAAILSGTDCFQDDFRQANAFQRAFGAAPPPSTIKRRRRLLQTSSVDISGNQEFAELDLYQIRKPLYEEIILDRAVVFALFTGL